MQAMANDSRKGKEFPTKVKVAAWKRCGGHCENKSCGAVVTRSTVQYDHVLPIGLGGEPTVANCQVVCLPCHKAKSKVDTGRMKKADRQLARSIGAKKSKHPMKSRNTFEEERPAPASKKGKKPKYVPRPPRPLYGRSN